MINTDKLIKPWYNLSSKLFCSQITALSKIYVTFGHPGSIRVQTIGEFIMLVDGKWIENWQPVQSEDEQGRFIRQTSSFRHWVTPDGAPGPTGEGGFKAERDRYHLYVAYICPWASRALMARALKGLQDIITVSVVNPVLTD